VIEIDLYNGQKTVDSYDLYLTIGLTRTNYVRWIKNIKERGGRDIDWFISDNLKYKNRKIKKRYYFTLDFARAICIRYKLPDSNKLIVFLKEEINR